MDENCIGVFDRVHMMDFGTVDINSTSKKVFEVRNGASIDQVYKVERYIDIPKLDSGFKIIPNSSTAVKPGKAFSFRVELTPKAVNMRISDYFVIKHLFGVEATIFTKATIEGPECSLSCTIMQIACSHDKKKSTKTFKIRSCGGSLVSYHIATDNDHSTFTFSPSQGKIKPSESIDITVTFTSAKHGLFFKRVFCLVENHEPLVLDIYAIKLKHNESPSFKVVHTNLPVYKNGYHCFMNNVMSKILKQELPLVSMTVCHIDFKHCAPNSKKAVEFSLTNNQNSNVVLLWNERVDRAFFIQPSTVEIEANGSANFKAFFQPSCKDKLFSSDFEARLLSDDQIVPFPVGISLKGHSFEETSCGWAAQYKVEPRCVTLPPCMARPFRPSHSTLTIHRFGHLPLAFKFHPPEKSNFTVKPQQGLIHKNFQIVVVQFQPKKIHDLVYAEKWMLSFNSNENVNQCYVEFGASIETPQLIVNNGLDVVFPKAHPGSPTETVVDLYNPTRFSFWFNEEVLKGESVLMVGHGGEIWPHEHRQVTWTFCPQGVGDLEALVCCTPSMGADIEVKAATVTVRGVCEETILRVMPHGLIYDKSLCEHEDERGFEIINSGEALVTGTLMWLSGDSCNADDVTIRFEPDTFTLQPGSSTLVKVFVTPHTTGTKSLTIGYSLNEISATPLIPVFIDGVFPCVQVSDIRLNNTGPLFTKLDVWRTLKISKLNEILEAIKPDKPENISMRLPSFVCTSDTVTVELLLENISGIAVYLKLTREQGCECKPQLQPVSFSRRQWKDVCPHKTQLKISPLAARVEAHSTMVLNLDVRYSTLENVACVFNLSLTPEDYENISYFLKLEISRYSIPEGASYLDSVEPVDKGDYVFNMKSVFIGDCYPFLQAFYLYNNTKHSVFYEVEDKYLVGTPFKYVGDRSTISPLSNHALFFTFLPNSCDSYGAFVELTVNSLRTTKLLLKGTGMLDEGNDDFDSGVIPSGEKMMSLNPLPVFLSTSHINIGPIKQGSAQRHILFFNNKTKDIVSFKWHTTKLPGVVELRVHPSKGAVQPGGAVECRAVAYSKGWPCDFTCSLTCVCASFSKYSSMVQKTLKYREDLSTCADYFVITENGTENIELALPQEDWPRKSYLTVSARVVVKYDAVGGDPCLPFAPAAIQHPNFRDSLTDVDEGHKLFIIQIMEMVLWETLDGLYKSSSFRREEPLERYVTLKDSSEQTDVAVPSQVLQTTMEDVLYSVWQNFFQLTPRNSTEHLRRTLIMNLQQISRMWYSSDDSIGPIHATTSIAESMTSDIKYS